MPIRASATITALLTADVSTQACLAHGLSQSQSRGSDALKCYYPEEEKKLTIVSLVPGLAGFFYCVLRLALFFLCLCQYRMRQNEAIQVQLA